MFTAIFSLTILGATLGLALGIAGRFLAVEANANVAELEALLPGTNCGQCGFPGCSGAAAALVGGAAPATCCPVGGKALAVAIAEKLGVRLDLSGVADEAPKLALVAEDLCIGCCRCIKTCPTDAILGAPKQIHNVLKEACTGCAACVAHCPTEAILLHPVPVTLPHWVMPKPSSAVSVGNCVTSFAERTAWV
ncbi:electron transport complex subunit RnfB [Betaproteobacteria bacterium]|nr:electron transport complex subunit RnfB [Betaproteobacteria bacterium]GHU09556.1 electron transport complex subunit RnfB [Betaproteobacteria bacterium]GHU23448.1 electron transport complex subunit RnfB [Betaproteobacteria bacterium]GHU30764.1 electron transport complex subunit RnfB [Betaproteobacteria bacterium]GHU45616.1 electron transport complex subunit RnfB [Betaproteobacteria bacterium]